MRCNVLVTGIHDLRDYALERWIALTVFIWCILQEAGAAMSSALAEGTLEAQQACFLPTSPDGLPVLGKIPGIEGAYIASGASSHLY